MSLGLYPHSAGHLDVHPGFARRACRCRRERHTAISKQNDSEASALEIAEDRSEKRPRRFDCGIEHEAIDDAHDVVIFEDFGNGQTKLTFIGNETMENAKNSRQLEGWNQILDKVAAVVAGLAQAK